MVRLRTCPICSYKANSLTALKHHLLRHNGSLERKRALRAISKQLNTTSTPVARSRAGSESSPLHDKFRELFPAEFQSSSSSSPEQNSSGEKKRRGDRKKKRTSKRGENSSEKRRANRLRKRRGESQSFLLDDADQESETRMSKNALRSGRRQAVE
ncbi:hypothetical protein TNCV_3903741 [Trichonephila clavipes]|nr:hypothetical protein TNCV_3903741 [Trichonephila clavipes]